MTRLLTALSALAAALVLAPAAFGSTTYTVNDPGDGAGPCPSDCTLRDAITQAVNGDTINFAVGTVTVDSTLPPITQTITIDGGGHTTVAESPTVSGPLFTVTAGSPTFQNLSLAGPGSSSATSLVQVSSPSGLTIRSSSLHNARTSGVSLIAGAQHVRVTGSPIYAVGTKPISFDAPGVNNAISPPQGLHVGPRHADGSVAITGTSGVAGTLELFRGDPKVSDAFMSGVAVGAGPFSVAAPGDVQTGDRFSATLTDGAGDTSEWATTTVGDITSPWVVDGVATSLSAVRVQTSEPVDPGSVQTGDFSLEMAGVTRPVTSAAALPDGSGIVITTSKPWGPGDAGLLHVTAPGALTDTSGNASMRTDVVNVGGAPGDFIPPVVTSLKMNPKRRLCLYARPRCRHVGSAVSFRSSEDGKAWLTVRRGRRWIGTARLYPAQPGDNYIRWDGKIHGQRLRPGNYRMYVGVQDIVGNLTPLAAQPKTNFSVAKPRRRHH